MSRRFALYAILLALLLGVAHGAYWVGSAGQIEAQISGWRDAQRRAGYVMTYGGPEIGGYPTRFVARFAEPVVLAPDGWAWTGPDVVGDSTLWSPLTVSLRFAGRHEIALRGVAVGDAEPRIELDLGHASATLQVQADGRLDHLESLMRNGTVSRRGSRHEERTGTSTEIAFESLTLALGPPIAAVGEELQSVPIAGEANRVVLPELPANPLGPEIRRIAFEGTLVGQVDAGGDARSVLAAWRDGGGYVQLSAFATEWGPLGIAGEGRLSLDREFRPVGALSSQVSGLNGTLDALAARNVIEPGVLVAAKLGLALLPKQRDAEGRVVVPLPLLLRDGLLYVNFGLGQIPVLRLAPIL